MEEKQALLNKEQENSRKLYPKNVSETPQSGSEASDGWWEESHSSCSSSCCDLHSGSSFEWESEINENGELFYIESDVNFTSENVDHNEYQKPEVEGEGKAEKIGNMKGGSLKSWIRRRDGKTSQMQQKSKPDEINQSQTQTQLQEAAAHATDFEKELIKVTVKVEKICEGSSLSEKLLGLSLCVLNENKIAVVNIHPEGPMQQCKDLLVGDILLEINNIKVTPQNLENILGSLNFPTEVLFKFEKTESYNQHKNSKHQSSFVKALLEKNEALEAVLLEHPVGVVVVNMESQNLNKDDVIYSYPNKCVLSSCRGAFVTLYHLFADINPKDECQSSSIIMKSQPTHVLHKSENNFLFLIAIPKRKSTLKEATFIVDNVIRNLLFTHQTLKRCFERNKKQEFDHFFSLFFSRVLTDGFSSNALQFISLENILSFSAEESSSQFEDILPHAVWVPLPKEAQIQIDDTLSELEANDIEHEDENTLKNQRLFNIIGSCLFHKGFLMLSHLPKEDTLDVYNFYRQNCLIQLFRSEPVKSLIVWKKVFPQSVNRGLPMKNPSSYQTPSGKWFLLIVGQGYDSLAIILESGICCARINENAALAIAYIEEAQDTLRHMQKLGISSLASQWIENNSRYKTITPEEVFSRKAKKKKENLLGLVKSFEGNSKSSALNLSSGNLKSSDTTTKKTRGFQHDKSEDSVSQTASNVSEVSDENAPILGRRAERGRVFNELDYDSDSSSSDLDSSRDSNTRGSTCSSGAGNFYLGDMGEVIPSKLTTGPDYLLFSYINVDGNEGILLNAPLNPKRLTPKMMEVLRNFRRCAQIIHSIFESNINFKKNNQDCTKDFINKSLIAVKELGVLFECCGQESDCHKKPPSFTYWTVGKLFYTPQPREVYVCYCDDAPQSLVEIAFRLGLKIAG